MTRPFTVSIAQFGVDGPTITSGYGPPPPPCSCPVGSFYICRDDGAWWQKTIGGTWNEVGSGGGPSSTVTLPNGEGAPIEAGMPAAVLNGMARIGDATSQSLALLIGIVIAGASPTLPVTVLTQGPITLTTSEWDAVTGGAEGLTPDALYFLGTTPGTLRTAPPTAAGQLIALVGQAVNPTTLLVGLRSPVLL